MKKLPEEKFFQSIMSVQEVARFLNIPAPTVYELVRKGKIRAVRFGKHWRVLRKNIEDYLQGSQNPSGSAGSNKEQRESPRLNSEIRAHFSVALNSKQNLKKYGVIRNLSEGGVFFEVETGEMPSEGDPVSLGFEIPGAGKNIQASGRVVHLKKNGTYGAGIKFRALADGVREVIANYVG